MTRKLSAASWAPPPRPRAGRRDCHGQCQCAELALASAESDSRRLPVHWQHFILGAAVARGLHHGGCTRLGPRVTGYYYTTGWQPEVLVAGAVTVLWVLESTEVPWTTDSCATMSSHTCYRTSRSFHFPFGAVCSLSGTQPEISLGPSRLHPHVEKGILSLFVASSQFNVLRASLATRVRRPRARPGPVHLG